MTPEEHYRLTLTLTNQVLELQQGMKILANSCLELQKEIKCIQQTLIPLSTINVNRLIEEINLLREEKDILLTKIKNK